MLLDEIGELPLPLQVKLLRVLQERKVRGVGATDERAVDVRVLAATNRNVEEDVARRRFRQDLYYRLNVIRIEVPPLRDRREDVRPLAEHFLARCAAEQDKDIRASSPDALRALEAIRSPATSASSRTSSSAPWRWRRDRRSASATSPARSAGAAAQPTPALVGLPEEGCNLDEVLGEVERRLFSRRSSARAASGRTPRRR